MDLKQFRDTQGLTQDELAELLGVSKNFIYLLEKNKRQMSHKVQQKFDELVTQRALTSNKVCESQQEKTYATPNEGDVCALCGQKHCGAIREDEVDVYQPRHVANTVLDNNHKLTEISNGIIAISNGIGALTKLDKLVQRRVDHVMSTRSRALIAVYNHHIEAQAKVMINDLESLINLLRAGAISLDGAIMMLEDHKKHLGDLRGYDPSDPTHNPTGGSPWNAPQQEQ